MGFYGHVNKIFQLYIALSEKTCYKPVISFIVNMLETS